MLEPASGCFFPPHCLSASQNFEEGSLIAITCSLFSSLPSKFLTALSSVLLSYRCSHLAPRLPSGPGLPQKSSQCPAPGPGPGQDRALAMFVKEPNELSSGRSALSVPWLVPPTHRPWHSRRAGVEGGD